MNDATSVVGAPRWATAAFVCLPAASCALFSILWWRGTVDVWSVALGLVVNAALLIAGIVLRRRLHDSDAIADSIADATGGSIADPSTTPGSTLPPTPAREQPLSDLGAFAALAVHDLRAPIRQAAGFVDLMDDPSADASSRDTYLEQIRESTNRMRRLVDSLSDFARWDRDVALAPIRLDEAVDAARESLAAEIEAAGADVTVGELPTATANRAGIEYVMRAVLENALVFRGDRPPSIRVVEAPGANATDVTIAVHDNGIGIDGAYRERVFEPFARLHGRGVFPGVGLGLTVARRIVERLGGSIRVGDPADGGASVLITLRRAGTAARPNAETPIAKP